MNKAILSVEAQKFIKDSPGNDITGIALGKSPFKDVSPQELAGQIEGKKRCEKKLPLWNIAPGIYYPSRLAIEQTSSQVTAEYKSHLIYGSKVVDITGGFGVDSFFFSRSGKETLHCEIDAELSAIAKHNAQMLKADNIDFHVGSGLDFIKQTEQFFDTIYADPSRRVKSQKVFFLKDCEPDLATNLHLLLTKAQRILIKTSPLLDISSGLKELNQVSQIHVVSVKGEVKELLWAIDRGFSDEPKIICAAIHDTGTSIFSFFQNEEKKEVIELYSAPLKYVYEPDAALLKAGCFKLIASRFNLLKLDKNTHLYTTENFQETFIGKIFTVVNFVDYKLFSKSNSVNKANVISKNFPLSVEALRKKHRIEDGVDDYLIFTTAAIDALIVIFARRK